MKVKIDSISGKEEVKIVDVKTMEQFKQLIYDTGCTLIETDLYSPNAHKDWIKWNKERFKDHEIKITLHDDYIE